MAVYQIKYGINGLAKYISHLDLAQVFERSMRRAEIPLAFSEGFNPHPKISFGSALAVGVSSSGEYLEVQLQQQLLPGVIKERLNAALPQGFTVYEVREVEEKGKALMAILNRAVYQVEVSLGNWSVAAAALTKAIKKILNEDEIKIMRKTKKGPRIKDIRPGIINVAGEVAGDKIFFNLLLATGSEVNVRPEEVLALVFQELNIDPMLIKYAGIHREGLYIAKSSDQISAPFEG